MSMEICINCGQWVDTDFINGEYTSDSDGFVCDFCISELTDEELKKLGITR